MLLFGHGLVFDCIVDLRETIVHELCSLAFQLVELEALHIDHALLLEVFASLVLPVPLAIQKRLNLTIVVRVIRQNDFLQILDDVST